MNLLTIVRRLPEGAIWQVIAIGRANLALTAMGLALGGSARAGMEDTLHVRKGELVAGNRPLVARAATLGLWIGQSSHTLSSIVIGLAASHLSRRPCGSSGWVGVSSWAELHVRSDRDRCDVEQHRPEVDECAGPDADVVAVVNEERWTHLDAVADRAEQLP